MSLSVFNQLQENSDLFAGKKVVVIGDVALDKTFLCTSSRPYAHTVHSNETILDVEPTGDDFGTVGAANNSCIFYKELGVSPVLVSAVGDDVEGKRVSEILHSQGTPKHILEVNGLQTPTKYRFFEHDDGSLKYKLKFRIDKDPLAATALEDTILRRVEASDFREWLQKELQNSDALLLNDTQKGFLSEKVLGVIGEILKTTNEARISEKRHPVVTLVDPKYDWAKFSKLSVDVLTPNRFEASSMTRNYLGVSKKDNDDHWIALAEEIYQTYGERFRRIVITLGKWGALLVQSKSDGATVVKFPAFEGPSSQFESPTHCSEMFSSALLIALTLEDGIDNALYDAITFGNCVGALQFSKRTGEKVSRLDLLNVGNKHQIEKSFRGQKTLHVISDLKDKTVNEILKFVGRKLDYRESQYARNGVSTKLIIGIKLKGQLDSFGSQLGPGRIALIEGDSGCGKSELLKYLDAFITGYDAALDCKAAGDVLASDESLRSAISVAASRGTCLVLDEIGLLQDEPLGRLLKRFAKDRSEDPFALICAGRVNQKKPLPSDLASRAGIRLDLRSYAYDDRKWDIPFLIAKMIRDRGDFAHIKRISAIALRELIRCDYQFPTALNSRGLSAVVNATCVNVKGESIEWEDIDFAGFQQTLSRAKPAKPELNYHIELI